MLFRFNFFIAIHISAIHREAKFSFKKIKKRNARENSMYKYLKKKIVKKTGSEKKEIYFENSTNKIELFFINKLCFVINLLL